jgi:hypothetical protein
MRRGKVAEAESNTLSKLGSQRSVEGDIKKERF